MIKFKSRKFYLIGSFVSLVAVGSAIFAYQGAMSKESNIEVKISDFPVGTRINYEILANSDVIENGSKIVSRSNILNLPMPDSIPVKSNNILSYKLNMQPPTQDNISSAETLDMLIKIDPDNGDISVSGSGLNGFSDIDIKKGAGGIDGNEKITSDWAGLFSMQPLNNISKDGQIELAFQNIGIASDFNQLETGKVEVFLGDSDGPTIAQVRNRYVAALQRMTEELSAVMALQTGTIGMFFDASIQLKVQRKHQELMARAHKDYHPSEQMCRIGTFIRSVAHSESKAAINKHALNKILMNQYLATPNNSAASGPSVNNASEIELYKKSFCDPRDNSGSTYILCPPDAANPPTVEELDGMNKDIDYTRILGGKLTLDVDFVDGDITGTVDNDLEGDEADIIALAKNLYFPNVFEAPNHDRLKQDLRPHYDSRSFAAKMNVAHSSFLNIVGMKSRAPAGQPNVTTANVPAPAPLGTGLTREPEPAPVHTHPAPDPSNPPPALVTPLTTTRTMPTTILTEDSGWAYMKAMLREFGIVAIDMNNDGDTTDAEDLTVEEQIDEILGERPSYYAQMEVLTKKIYQHPNFYTNLYDKPANVARIGASIDAITLMNQRDRFDSIIRREMLTSLLIEEELGRHVENVNSTIYEQMQQNQYE